ncbi:helix-turn-helix domain-containing protein [Actinomadura atramentaria]|uniref:helix-turn-helix domain-containing protein n=1 Tax=Actinomadura atramentaria TaxID=1990 RepID=UPI0003793CB4|nr:helix-turn-helix transcriptional regulator [Actinomadura atramentaria]
MAYIPTIRGRRLARELRALREERGMTGAEAAALLGWDGGKLSRIETAKVRVTVGEVMEICEEYKIEGEQRANLIQLARDARKQGWWQPYQGVLKPGFSDYLAFEAEAQQYRSYEVQLIPGLLQCESYARAVLRTSTELRTTEEVERAVEARVARQKRLTDAADQLQVFQIIEEGALHRLIGGAETMREQHEHLLDLSMLPNVSIQVIPFRAASYMAFDGPFVLFNFDGYPDILYVEHFGGCQYYEKLAETAHGRVVYEHLQATALNTSDSAALIRNLAGKLTSK